MKISPISQNQYHSQNPSFNAINQKYYEWGKKEIEERKYITYNFLYCISCAVRVYESISPQDGLDTLKALRDLLKPNKDDYLNELVGDFKQLIKKESALKRRALKKLKKT